MYKLTVMNVTSLLIVRNLEHIEPLAFNGLTGLEVLECQNNKNLNSVDPFAFYENIDAETR